MMEPTEKTTMPHGIGEQIELSRQLFEAWGASLQADPSIRTLLAGLEAKIAASQGAMLECGVVAACTRCDEEEGGSCCGAGIENKYNAVLLLMNRLLGTDPPVERRWESSCLFLGERGCTLRVRDVLCLNYLCMKIQKMLEPRDLIRLQNVVGDEMDAVFFLLEKIKKFIRHETAAEGNRSPVSEAC